MMNRRNFTKLGAAAGALICAPTILRAQNLDIIRCSYANTTVVSAQAMQVLKNTDIGERNGLKLELIQLANSPVISESLVSGVADVGAVSDFSSVTLMAAGAPVVPVARLSNFRSAILATKNSSIKTMADLKGKTVYGLFGITAYLNAQEAVRAAGLVPGKDVTFVNIATPELSDAVRAQKIDAFFTWDPFVTLFESLDVARVISQNVTPAMVLQARSKFITEKPEVLKKFLRAHAEALYFASQNHEMTNTWFKSQEPAKSIPTDVIDRASGFDPAWNAKKFSEVKMTLSDTDLAQMEKMGKWGYGEKLLGKAPDVKKLANLAIAQSVDAEAASKPFNLAAVKVKA